MERAGEDWVLIPNAQETHGTFGSSMGNIEGSYLYQKQSRIDGIDTVALRPGQGYLLIGSELRKFSYPHIKGKDPSNMVRSYGPKGHATADGERAPCFDEELVALQKLFGINWDAAQAIAKMKGDFGFGAIDSFMLDELEAFNPELGNGIEGGNIGEIESLLIAEGYELELVHAIMDIIQKRAKFNEFRADLIAELNGHAQFWAELGGQVAALQGFMAAADVGPAGEGCED